MRIFLYVYDGEQALEIYTLHIKKDGADVPVNGTSFGGQPGFTWPIADLRQRFQNMKVEFPNVAARRCVGKCNWSMVVATLWGACYLYIERQ